MKMLYEVKLERSRLTQGGIILAILLLLGSIGSVQGEPAPLLAISFIYGFGTLLYAFLYRKKVKKISGRLVVGFLKAMCTPTAPVSELELVIIYRVRFEKWKLMQGGFTVIVLLFLGTIASFQGELKPLLLISSLYGFGTLAYAFWYRKKVKKISQRLIIGFLKAVCTPTSAVG